MSDHKKRILVLHGWNATNSEIWLPEVKTFFEPKGFEVTIPELPGNYFPDFKGWVQTVENFSPDENSILIGHSLGGTTILRYLEEAKKPVGQIILTATPINSMGFNQVDNFFGVGFDFTKIKENAKKINLIYEECDPVVPLEHGEELAKNLNVQMKIVPGGMHLPVLDMKVLGDMIDG